MKKLIHLHFHYYLIHSFILTFLLLTVFYLIMVNITRSKLEMNYINVDSRDFIKLQNGYKLFKRNANFNVSSNQFRKYSLQKMDSKVILIWSPLFEDWNFLQIGKNTFRDSGCLETRCEITSDRSRLLQSDAILFHVRTLSMLDIPRARSHRQKWIFFTLEAPPYSSFQGLAFMVNMFNWTMTYRKDSDIYIPYGQIIPKDNKAVIFSDMYNMWKNKTKMAVWMASHCITHSNREKFVDDLKSFIDVDTYGGCGLGTCPFNKTNFCIANFSKQYYFFLAFENSICDDYITEKLYRTLQYDMIPVVFGGGDYSSMAPPNSYVDALKFQSPQQLAGHLYKIASNFTLFSSYFKWRTNGYSRDKPNQCELCQKLHSDEFKKHSTYFDINEWWVKKSNCKTSKNTNKHSLFNGR